jgi:acyl-CoA thioesterase
MINQGLEENLFAALQKKVKNIPFYDFLGFEPLAMGPGQASFKLVLKPEYANVNETLHGGLMMSLADAAMAFAARSLGYEVTTINLSTSFFHSVSIRQELRAEGSVIKSGAHLVFCSCRLYEGEKLVGENQGIFYILKALER